MEAFEKLNSKIKGTLRKIESHSLKEYKQEIEDLFESFESQYKDLYEEKKQAYLEAGLELRDFSYYPFFKKQFEELSSEYKKIKKEDIERQQQLERKNLKIREQIIEDIQLLISSGSKTLLSSFKSLQKKWKEASPIPIIDRGRLSNSYRFQVNNFYNYLDIHKELQERQFEYNFHEKAKVLKHAESLIIHENPLEAQKELSELHSLWKEIGPVMRCYTDGLWNRFMFISRQINQNKEVYIKVYRDQLKSALKQKKEILNQLEKLFEQSTLDSYDHWKKMSNQVENLVASYKSFPFSREQSFRKVNNQLRDWLKKFNKSKNDFYKKGKDEIKLRLDERKSYVNKARDVLEAMDKSLDYKIFEIKKLQKEWSKLKGFLPRKQSQTVWDDFKNICNKVFELQREEKKEACEKKEILLNKEIKFSNLSKSEAEQKALDLFEKWVSVDQINERLDRAFSHKIEDALKENGNFNQKEIAEFFASKVVETYTKGKSKEDLLGIKKTFQNRLQQVQLEINKLETNKSFFSGNAKNNPLLEGVLSNLKKLEDKQIRLQQEIKNINKSINAMKDV